MNLTVHVDVMLGQEAGTKAYCIEQMKKFGFDNTHVLMIGDAPGDLDAAEKEWCSLLSNSCWKRKILLGSFQR